MMSSRRWESLSIFELEEMAVALRQRAAASTLANALSRELKRALRSRNRFLVAHARQERKALRKALGKLDTTI